MSTSPNDEILSAISEHAPTLHALNGSQPVSPIERTISKRRSNPTLGARARSQKRKEKLNSRVGVWVDGVVHWDSAIFLEEDEQVGTISDTGFAPVRPVSSGDKPQLSVVIPGEEPLINDQTISRIMQPQPRRPLVSVAPASLTSRFAIPPHNRSAEQSKEVSPASSQSEQPPALPPRPNVIQHYDDEKQVASRNSSSSSSGVYESGSGCSRRSSATSVEVLQTHSSTAKDKPLPPLPPPRSSRVAIATPVYRPDGPAKSVQLVANPNRLQPKQLRQSRSISELDSCDRQFMRTSPYGRHVNGISPTLSQAEEELRNRLETMSPRPNDEPKELEDTSIPKNSEAARRKSSVSDVMEPPARAPTIPKRSRKRDWRATGSTARKDIYLPPVELPTRRRSESQMKQIEDGRKATKQRPQKSASVHTSGQRPLDLSFGTARPGSSESRDSQYHDAQTHVVDFADANAPAKAAHSDAAEKSWLDIESEDVSDEEETSVPETIPEIEEKSIPETISESDECSTQGVPSSSAENVLLGILSSLHSTRDLFNTAMINRGMYRVYKENEMELIRTISYNESAPAWELREWSPPEKNDVDSSKASSLLEHTPDSYQRCHKRDLAVIERLKRMILEQCQTFIRRETAFALSTPTHPNAARYNDAFWRIWCFCMIFGCDKGREDDVTGQLDWLKGGVLANNQGCVATVNTNLDFDMSSVLLNAPDHFSKANTGGLSTSQLFDMTEIWTCMTSLLQAYQGRINQARQYGVFDALDIMEGDVEKEEQALEEWTAYLLTLGPHVVLEMAELAADTKPAGFAFAKRNGWTSWAPPLYNSGTRTTFLKEPVKKSYEEQVILHQMSQQDPAELEMKERSRQRVATMAAEIRLRRQSSDYKRLPLIDMSSERPMSVFSRRDSSSSVRSGKSTQSRSVSRRSTTTPASSTALWEPPKKISPIMEEREHNHRLSLQNFADGIAEDTSERAVKRIVSMGFTVSEARDALRITDMGDGIRLDRAVELLLRRQSAS